MGTELDGLAGRQVDGVSRSRWLWDYTGNRTMWRLSYGYVEYWSYIPIKTSYLNKSYMSNMFISNTIKLLPPIYVLLFPYGSLFFSLLWMSGVIELLVMSFYLVKILYDYWKFFSIVVDISLVMCYNVSSSRGGRQYVKCKSIITRRN